MKRKFKRDKPANPKNYKICTLCEKPHSNKAQCCRYCNKQLKNLRDLVDPKRDNYKVSIAKLLYLKQYYNVDDIFSYINEDLRRMNISSYKSERLALKRNVREYHRKLKDINYVKWEGDIPPFIKKLLGEHRTKEFLTLSGNRHDPFIHYVCKRCGEEQAQLYSELLSKKSHDGISNKSSGEAIIESYLKRRYEIKTQRDTLFCRNPITGRQLPYDIEIPILKIVIEVQGPQHYKYIPYFHGSEENFYYQQRKDDYKRRYAEKHGYQVIYIDYADIGSGKYQQLLSFEDGLSGKD